jgi:hypothetical protein
MKNLARLILALFATQLLVTGIARASITSTSINQQAPVNAMPDGDDIPGEAW